MRSLRDDKTALNAFSYSRDEITGLKNCERSEQN